MSARSDLGSDTVRPVTRTGVCARAIWDVTVQGGMHAEFGPWTGYAAIYLEHVGACGDAVSATRDEVCPWCQMM
jgi:hypothetical protein